MYQTGVLRKISRTKAFKATTLFLVAEMIIQTLNPPFLLALTSGPTQPEVEAFQPAGITDMVDPFSGDFSYNIPLMTVGDYPLNLAYQSGVAMDDEASWSGLGWNVHSGAITRQMRGLPDDFWGDKVERNVYMRDNFTVGAKVMLGFETFGLDLSDYGVNLGVGFDVNYNTYKGVGLTSLTSASVGTQAGSGPMNLGLSLAAGPEGLNISPNISFSAKFSSAAKDASGAGGGGGAASLGFGFNINSRAGLTGMTLTRGVSLNGSKDLRGKYTKDDKGNKTYEKGKSSYSVASHSSSINFGQPTFSPQIDLPMENSAGSGRFKVGGAVFGQDIDGAITGYGAQQKLAKNKLENPAYGYMYAEKAEGNLDALHDFNREKDGTFTKEKKNLPLTNQTYDLYNISAQGLGGTFRAYRNDAGHVYDKRASSPSTSIDFGGEIGPGNLIDFGLDFTANVLESESKSWTQGNGAGNALKFQPKVPNDIRENFHFKMTGEKNVDAEPAYNTVLRNDKPVAIDLDHTGNPETPSYTNFVEPNGQKYPFGTTYRKKRQPRNTAVYHFTVAEVLRAFPWKRHYISPHAKNHHIAEIVVIQPDGKRYVFGLAVYNSIQREISFNVGAGGATPALPADASTGLVSGATQAAVAPGAKRGIDHFYDETVTPAYVHSWLLTEIQSADYVDVTGDGPTPDDLGTYTKFNYGNRNADGSLSPDISGFEWRTPTTGNASASYMQGFKTDLTDDKGSIIYGRKDVWYVHSIENKTQVAVFTTGAREDGLGANIDGALQSATHKRLRRLESISLYSRQEYIQQDHTPVPIKTAHFEYDYSLCPGTPNSVASGKGKLTLKKVYFTYKNSLAGQFSPYRFSYRETPATGGSFSYQFGKMDRWGVPKPSSQQPGTLNHADWPYASQNKASRDDYSSAWHLNKIQLPSGSEINITYESDDYGFVQDKAAMRMFRIKGLATSREGQNLGNKIFPAPLGAYRDYIILDLNDPSTTTTAAFKTKYLQGYGKGNHENNPLKYLYYRFMINVNGLNTTSNPIAPPEFEYVSGYSELDFSDCGINGNGEAYIKVKRVSAKMGGIWTDVSPFAYSAWQFSRIQTPRKAFGQPEATDDVMSQVVQMLASANLVEQIVKFIQGPNGAMNAQGHGSTLNLPGCWIRLLEPDKTKLGGNSRVKEITISDEWNEISSSEPAATYGQEFSYVDEDGRSTGVAAYEPGVGADENPFRMPSFYSGPKQILIPEERYYLEEPFGESFFPGPSVGYSKVTVRDKTFDPDVTLNRTGYTVHEFYTAYDFPTDYDQTPIDVQPREQGVLAQLFSPNKRKYMTASQGYTVTLNDMHGKQKAVSMYAEGESAPFAYTKYHYKTAGGKLDNKVDVVDREGNVSQKPVGVEIDFIADMREQSTYSETGSVTGNLATMMLGSFGPFTLPTIFATFTTEKTRFRSATTTKVIQQFGIQDVTETYDKGAYVQTKITAFDAHTGAPLIQELNNEFKDKYYKLDYPAHWAYTGMRQASENIGYVFSHTGSGPLTGTQHAVLEPGDEVLPLGSTLFGRKGTPAPIGNANTRRFWVALDDPSGQKYLIDNRGKKVSIAGNPEYFQVIRSGHRNMQSSSVGSVTSMQSPVVGTDVVVSNGSKVVAASALEFAEHWKTATGMLKATNQSSMYITYSQNVIDYISILNEMTDRGTISVTEPDKEYIDQAQVPAMVNLFPDCEFSIFDSLGYYSHIVQEHPDLFDNGDFPAPWNSPSYEVNVLHTSIYPMFGDTALLGEVDEQFEACHCKSTSLYPLHDAATFTAADWDNVLYFETQYPVSGSPLSLPDLLTITQYAPVIVAVMPGGVRRHVVMTSVCWPFGRTVVEGEETVYDCEYAEGDTINPYLYGILGNWRPKADYFFMGDRNNTDAGTAENLRRDGYLPDFKAYWKAPASSTDVWVRNTPAVVLGDYENWNRKTEMTLYSPFGFDLENKTPLPSYSSAQYGFYNTLPTAVVSNAQQKEIGFDGFEDYYPWITLPPCEKNHFKYEDYIDNVSRDQAHTGLWSMKIADGNRLNKSTEITPPYEDVADRHVPYVLAYDDLLRGFSPNAEKTYVLCFWAKPETRSHTVFDYTGITPVVKTGSTDRIVAGSLKKSKLINDWQRYELYFTVPALPSDPLEINIENATGQAVYVDDIRVHPFDANMKSFVYHMFDFKYMAQLDENNFATFYEYDEEGKLVRTKKETERGIMTLQENRTNLYKR